MPDDLPLCILQWNANGLRPKLAEFMLFLIACQIQVAMVQESHLDHMVDINSICSYGYQIFRKDRDRHGGGLLILALRSITAQEFHLDSPPGSHLELQGVRIWRDNRCFNLVNVYRPPDAPCLNLDMLLPLLHPVIISGDFNAHANEWDPGRSDPSGQTILDFTTTQPF